ncbi:MAG: MFS transporter, partial [Verrucomicrobia bacterium]|nr:MFS transporter [Verrucomicrobiota bacterium]
REPGRGLFDRDAEVTPPPWSQALGILLKNREYVLAVAGYTAVTFASGALADWFPTFLQNHRGMTLEESGFYVGASAVIGGLGGSLAGGFLGDALRRRTRQAYFALCGLSMVLATVFGILALRVTNPKLVIVMLFIAQFFLWFYNGPVNAILANAFPSALRARAFAFSILAIHLGGDAISPTIVACLDDYVGLPTALQLVPLAMAVGAGLWLYGWRVLPEIAPAPKLGRSA